MKGFKPLKTCVGHEFTRFQRLQEITRLQAITYNTLQANGVHRCKLNLLEVRGDDNKHGPL
jgi:hypothetical protein